MPAVLRVGRFRFFFFSNEGSEPPHIHVRAGNEEAKFWLEPIHLASNSGLKGHELKLIEDLIFEYKDDLLEAWHEHFGT